MQSVRPGKCRPDCRPRATRRGRLLASAAVLVLLQGGLWAPASAQQGAAAPAAPVAAAPEADALTNGLAGPYLAARSASASGDYQQAAALYDQAIEADPANPMLREAVILADVGRGDVADAVAPARVLQEAGATSQVGNLVLMADLAKSGDYAGLLKLMQAEGAPQYGPLVEGLVKAWAQLGQGQMSEASAAFDAAAGLKGMRGFALYHKALALASVGDFEGADAILSAKGKEAIQLSRRGVLAHAEILSQLERDEDALIMLQNSFGTEPDPTIDALKAQLADGKRVPLSAVTKPSDGIAEVFFSVAGALSSESTDVFTLVYARLAQYLKPDHVDATLLTAALLESHGQYDLATAAYNQIPRDDPAYPVAELGRADAMVAGGRTDAAIEALNTLAKSYPDQEVIWATLGDTLRQAEKYADAAKAYDAAIKLFEADDASQWPVYYARGIAEERQKQYDRAEADMRKALALSPDQPQVLNYLGYSFLEQNRNLEEAVAMIRKAVEARPQDGYIVDSLGWAEYRMGQYAEAVPTLEQAVGLMASDPTVNDHLGDAYWAVGRTREAEFQWRRALSFGPETEADATRIRRKLEVGLDKVLAEEGAAPLAVTKNGD